MSQKYQYHILRKAFSIFIRKFLVVTLVFVLSPYLIFLSVKSIRPSLSPAIIKVQKSGSTLSGRMMEYRIHPSWTEKNRFLHIVGNFLRKYNNPIL